MPSVSIKVEASDFKRLEKRISELLHDATHLDAAWQEAAEYMRRSTINRVLRTKTSPDGERWEALREITIDLKGHDSILFETGELSRSIQIGDVSNDGFMLTSNSAHASYMQDGVKSTGGFIPGRKIPPRPFMGFSDENKRRISKMIRDHLAHGGD